MTYDVLVVGGAGVDTVVRVSRLPLPVRDSTLVPPIQDYVGHTGNGVALGCHALGLHTKFIDFIGADLQGQLILERYAREGLDFSYLIHDSGTRRSVNLVDKEGNRASLHDPRHPPDLVMPREYYLPFLEASSHCHISIMNWARLLYDDALRLGITVSTDLHDWDGKNDYHRDFAYRSDIVIVSTAAVPDYFVELMHDFLGHGRASLVVATHGKHGSYLLTRETTEPIHVPAFDNGRPIVDTNGAGDSFTAAFLYGYLRGYLPIDCLRLGNLAGAFACSIPGTHEAFLGEADLLEEFSRK